LKDFKPTDSTKVPDPRSRQKSGDTIERLIHLVELLRSEKGCPWDRKQTPKSLSVYLIEEVYELIESMESGPPEKVCEELGDVLFQVIFIASIYKESGFFDIKSSAAKSAEKMIRRHPHVFGDKLAKTVRDIKKQWREIKQQEIGESAEHSILDSVPVNLPGLVRAYRISERAAGAGFDWDDIKGVMSKAEEEWAEFNSALSEGNNELASMEFGDVLFTLVNVARFAGIHPEIAIGDSTNKFKRRFKQMEKALADNGKRLEDVSREDLELLWEKAKKEKI